MPWCAAVSTGEEAYSLSVVLHDAIEKNDPINLLEFWGDINQEVLTKAAGGVFKG